MNNHLLNVRTLGVCLLAAMSALCSRACAQDSDRLMLDDITADENFERTEGLDLVWQAQNNPANVAISSVGAELKNMAYYDTEYRWP